MQSAKSIRKLTTKYDNANDNIKNKILINGILFFLNMPFVLTDSNANIERGIIIIYKYNLIIIIIIY